MTLIEAIHAENEQILSTLEKLEDTTSEDLRARQELLGELELLLDEQQVMNERLVYPVFTAAEADDVLADRSRQELAEIGGILRELARSHLDDPEVKFDIENLGSLVRLHVEHEQEELLPGAEEVLEPEEEERLADLAAEEFERLRQRLQG